MKRIPLLFALLLAVPSLASAQTQTRDRRSINPDPSTTGEATAVRKRVVGPARVANHAERQNSAYPADQKTAEPSVSRDPESAKLSAQTTAAPKWGNTPVVTRSAVSEKMPGPVQANRTTELPDRSNKPATKLIQSTAIISEVKPAATSLRPSPNTRTSVPLRVPAPTAVYHVGAGDVLDIRLANVPTRESTLFTVLKNGMLEYPLLNGPISVAGLTTEEIANRLTTEIKVIRAAQVNVAVRDYASHAVLITGLVDSPGRKILRREAMPLYAVLAEALPRAEATMATVSRAGKTETVNIDNEPQMSMLVFSGDVIKVSGNAVNVKGFVYVSGDVTAPGEKEFRDGMTLTQALISAGGAPRSGKVTVKLSRRNAGGFLTANEFDVQSIQDGKAQDPLLQAGDRIEVIRGL